MKVLSCHRRFIYPDISCKVKNVLLGGKEEALKLQVQDKKIVGFMHFEFRLIVLQCRLTEKVMTVLGKFKQP